MALPPLPPDTLVCPETRLPLRPVGLEEAEAAVGGGEPLAGRGVGSREPVGPTRTVMLRRDGRCAYPILDGIPVLLRPEMLVPASRAAAERLADPTLEAVYAERQHYDALAARAATDVARSRVVRRGMARVGAATPEQRRSFPEPREVWLDAVYDAAAQFDAYRHLAPVAGKRFLQVGGKGQHAVKFVLAGATEGWVVSPGLGELRAAAELARHFGVRDRVFCVAAVAEELPFADGTFDGVYSPSSVHHMLTEVALPECARVLRPSGRFASPEPWRAPLYGVGIRVFGKRDEGSSCRPLTRDQVAPLFSAFEDAAVVHHGALSRYPLIALMKMGLRLGLRSVWRVNRVDDAVSSALGLRRLGSSVAVLGTAPAQRSAAVTDGAGRTASASSPETLGNGSTP